ncbi:unnamed protein product [marine sediment metagenome]|uniref:Uncharacterized protein n=1 Tax=marine sediment metagenome TaxID=412755 RepID=X1G064_9ZZZZ
MPYIVSFVKYPSHRGPKIAQKYLEYLQKFPPDDSLGELIIPSAIKTYDFSHIFLETIKRAYNEMEKPLICIAYKIVDDTSDYANKVHFKRELFKLKIPVFESVDLAAKALDKLCTFREFQNEHNP